MSALGDYIHFRNKNYIEYGTAKISAANPKKYKSINSQVFFKNRLKNANLISSSALKKASEELKRRMQRNTPEKLKQDQAQLDKDFQDKINKLYEILMKKTDRAIAGGLIYHNEFEYTGNKEELKASGLSKKQVENRKRKLDELNKKITKLNSLGIVKETDIIELANEFKKITGTKISSTIFSDLGSLQEALLFYNYNNWVNLLAGDFGENYVALCSDAIENSSIDGVEEILNKLVIGFQRGESTFNKNKISVKLPQKTNTNQKRSITYNDDSGTYSLGYSQNKVDVKMTVNGVEILANVKDYYDSSKVSLQNQVSLLSSLIYLNSENEGLSDFGNHWLNMHAGQLKGKHVSADKILEKEIAFEALVSGNPLKRNVKNANVFVYMERSTGKVIVKPVDKILLDNFGLFSINPKVSNILFENNWVGKNGERSSLNANKRISILLAQVHQRHFNVSLRISELKRQ